MSIDFERAKLLMDIVVSAGQHGPMYQKLASEAGKELKAMVDEISKNEKAPRIVTPPEGPENSAIEHPDGTIERLVQPQPENTAVGQKSEVTGEDLNARARRMADEAELPGDKEALANKERLALQTDQREKNIQAELDLAREHRNSPDVRRKV